MNRCIVISIIILSFLYIPIAIADPLSITILGKGFVSSSFPYWISCSDSCTKDIDAGAQVTLRTAPDGQGQFLGWEGACVGSDASCTFKVQGSTSVTAKFSGTIVKEHQLTVYRKGQGSVDSDPAGISVGTTLDYDYGMFAEGSTVRVNAKPTPNSKFLRFEGDCTSVAKETCIVAMNAAKRVTVVFSASSAPVLKESCGKENQKPCSPCPSAVGCINGCYAPYVKGNNVCLPCPAGKNYVQGVCASQVSENVNLIITTQGPGSVSDSEGKINCGAGKSCGTSLPRNSRVSLTARTNPNAYFWGWAGACAGKSGCSVNLSGTRYVTAKFYEEHMLVVNKSKRGTIKSDDGKIDCGEVCHALYANGSKVILRPSFDYFSDVSFVSWGSDCQGRDRCELIVDAPKNVRARFNASIYNLVVVTKGDGKVNLIAPTPFNFSCIGNTCTAVRWYYSGGSVPLQIAKERDAIVDKVEWDCQSDTLLCAVPIDDDKEVVIHTMKNMSYVPKEAVPFKLNLYVFGPGKVIASDSNKSADCRGTCAITLRSNEYISIKAVADDGNQFVLFGGACQNITAPSCVVRSSAEDLTVGVVFSPSFNVTVIKRGTRTGTVASIPKIPVGIDCSPACGKAFQSFTAGVQLNATPSQGSYFAGWSGGCEPQFEPLCLINNYSNPIIRANFAQCTHSSHCPWDKECKNNRCVTVRCPCGEIRNHNCFAYECCQNYDCRFGTCNQETNLCVDDNGCHVVHGNPASHQHLDIAILGDQIESNTALKEKVDWIFNTENVAGRESVFSFTPFSTYKNNITLWIKNVPNWSWENPAWSINDIPELEEVLREVAGCPHDITIVLSDREFRPFALFPRSGYWGGIVFFSLPHLSTAERPRAMAHELGHALGHLADEYTEAGKGSYTDSINCAPDRYTAEQRWGDLDYLPGVGYFNGGTDGGCHYAANNVRPTQNSLMRHHMTAGGFDPVNERELTKALESYK